MKNKTTLSHILLLMCCLLPMLSPPCVAEIAVIVHPDSPITSLSKKDLKPIFLGRLYRWPNATQDLTILDQPSTAKLYQTFYNEIVGFNTNKLKRYRAGYLFSGKGKLPKTLGDQESVLSEIAGNKYMIGYVDATQLTGEEKVVFRWPGS